MEALKKLVREWPAHVVGVAVLAVVLYVLSYPEASSSQNGLVAFPVDLIKRLMYCALSLLSGYWVSRFFMQEQYARKKAGLMTPAELVVFNDLRSRYILGFMLAFCLWSA